MYIMLSRLRSFRLFTSAVHGLSAPVVPSTRPRAVRAVGWLAFYRGPHLRPRNDASVAPRKIELESIDHSRIDRRLTEQQAELLDGTMRQRDFYKQQ